MLSLLHQALLIAPYEDQRRDGDEQAEHDPDGSDWCYQPMYIAAEELE
jgi:hypothetical protein